jgi:pimeloyl-ACP methyl ester carboxylesterase
MTERVVRFGADEGLVGILTEAASSKLPAVVFLNAGVLHRAGPLNWYTTLARRLAGQGFPCLRFDLSGIGDSAIRNDPRSEVERALDDIQAALDFLTRRKSERFVLIGLCSGAMFAHHAAVRDPRVVGAVFLDGFGYRTFGYRWRHLAPRLARLSSWRTLGRRILGRFVCQAAVKRDARAPQFDEYFMDFPPQSQVREDLQALLKRGTRLFFNYSGGLAPLYFNDRRQFREMFGELSADGNALFVEYDGQADHLYSDFGQREAMFERVENWLRGFNPTIA